MYLTKCCDYLSLMHQNINPTKAKIILQKRIEGDDIHNRNCGEDVHERIVDPMWVRLLERIKVIDRQAVKFGRVDTGLYHFTKEPEPVIEEDETDSDETVNPLEVPVDESEVNNVAASKMDEPSYIEVDSCEFTLGGANESVVGNEAEGTQSDNVDASLTGEDGDEPGDVVVSMPILNNSINTDDGGPVDDLIDNLSEAKLDEYLIEAVKVAEETNTPAIIAPTVNPKAREFRTRDDTSDSESSDSQKPYQLLMHQNKQWRSMSAHVFKNKDKRAEVGMYRPCFKNVHTMVLGDSSLRSFRRLNHEIKGHVFVAYRNDCICTT